ncbi:MAG: AP2 domain-containing protein [Gammaproteobacteria bacterium]
MRIFAQLSTTTHDNSTGIYRTDSDRNGTHGWIVFAQRRKQIFTKHFSDGVHGGKSQGYRAARKYRERLIKEHVGLTRAEYASILRRNNTSGVPGVCKYGSGHWVAFWPTLPGKTRRVKFSVPKYGEKKAFELAVIARRRALEGLQEPFTRAPKKQSRAQRAKAVGFSPI